MKTRRETLKNIKLAGLRLAGFKGSDSSMAPLSAVDGAVADAVKKLLTDSAVETYLRK